MKLMNILFVTDLYPLKNDKTIPKIVEDFVLLFKKNNHNVCVIRPNLLINSIIRGHKIIKNGIHYSNNIKIYNKNFIFPFLNNDISFLEEKFDLIISNMPCGNIYASLINKKLNLPHIAIVHQSDYFVLNDFKYQFYFKKRLKNALEKATVVASRNKFLKEKLNTDFVLPSFIEDKNVVLNKTFDNKKLKMVTLSKLIKRKNIDKVICALSKIDFDFRYDIYGEGVEKNKLNHLIKKYNLENKVGLKGFIEHKKVFEILDNYDVFILPSVNETFGLSYLEALSRGLIAVGSKNTGIDGIIEHNKNGFLIEPEIKNIVEILNKINTVDKETISKQALMTAKKLNEENIYNYLMKKIEVVVKSS